MDQANKIIYVEFHASDLGKTKAFFENVFGWAFTDYGPDYTSFVDGQIAGGFFRSDKRASSAEGGVLVVIFHPQLEDALRRVVEHGGKITREIFPRRPPVPFCGAERQRAVRVLRPVIAMMTERQEQILDFIRLFQREKGVPPSSREIQRRFRLASQSTVIGHLRALANKGQIEQLAGRTWGLKALAVQAQLFEMPVFGTIPAGLPAMQEQTPDETIAVNPSVFGVRRPGPHQVWALRVQGDSMVDAHIMDGDLVVLERRDPREGDIIAALVDETTTTLKRLVHLRGRPVLRAANKRYRDIVPERRLESQGVVVGLIRRGAAAAW